MNQKEKYVQNILAELLAEDRQILGDKDKLIAVMKKRVSMEYTREFTPIRNAFEKTNVGELLLVADNGNIKEQENAKIKAMKCLAYMQATRARLVLDMIIGAMGWPNNLATDTYSHNLCKDSHQDNKGQVNYERQYQNSINESWDCVCGQKNNTNKFCPACGKSRLHNESLSKKRLSINDGGDERKENICKYFAQEQKRSEKLKDKVFNFINDYNYILNITRGRDADYSLEFQKKYDLLGIDCINVQECIQNLDINPIFNIKNSLDKSTLLEFKFKDYYVVVPNFISYDNDYYHNYILNRLFISEFEYKFEYSKVYLRKVAIISKCSNIYRRGDLLFSGKALKKHMSKSFFLKREKKNEGIIRLITVINYIKMGKEKVMK